MASTAATAARRAVVFGDDVAVQSIGGRRLDVVVSTQNVGPEDDNDDLTLAATVSKRDTTLRIELACAAPATTYAFSQLRTPLAVLPTPLDAALRRSNGASLPRRPGAYDAAARRAAIYVNGTLEGVESLGQQVSALSRAPKETERERERQRKPSLV